MVGPDQEPGDREEAADDDTRVGEVHLCGGRGFSFVLVIVGGHEGSRYRADGREVLGEDEEVGEALRGFVGL